MPDLALDKLIKHALTMNVLEMPQVQEIWKHFGTQNVSIDEFTQYVLRRGILTKYQLERLKFGETTGFFFGDYKALYLVGAGTFSRVYRATHRVTNQVVAVKVLRARFSQDQATVEDFLREARLSMGLSHPNIVTVHDAVSGPEGHYMVMDFIEGQTLRDMVKVKKIIDPRIASRIMIDVCSGLDFAFQRGHSHRDMKLSNVIVSSSGKAVLIDFGLSATEKESEQNFKNPRTIDYAALEKASGVQKNDRRSDLYFLGVMFYYILTGVSPILETKDRAKRLERSRFLNIVPLREKNPAVPPIISFIVEKAMSLDAEKRYQSPGSMLRDLEVALQKLAEGEASQLLSSDETTTSLAVAARRDDRKTILVVESNPQLQNLFRESLKKEGYRVLVMSDPERALERFEFPDHDISCVLLNAQSLGPNAVVGFNQLGKLPHSAEVPAILLLDETQVAWGAKAHRNKWRLAVGMPITMKRLQEVIHRLLSPGDGSSAGTGKYSPDAPTTA
ncbi:MAG: serine/threonine-protein kinase [Planctomycetia bacterium]|nr:serine/threonine-protein kinase [Planctomycetia bacterium]